MQSRLKFSLNMADKLIECPFHLKLSTRKQIEMNSITPYSSASPAPPDYREAYRSYAQLQAARISISEDLSKDITIFTDEGDKVTISSNQQSHAQYLTYEGLSKKGISGDYQGYAITRESLAMFKGERFEFETSMGISVSVDGDLNEQELKDIKKAIKGIDKIMTDLLYGGDMLNAIAKAKEIKELDTISGLEANYRYEKQVMVEQTSIKEATTYSRQGLAETSPLTKNTNYLNYLKTLIDEMADIVKESGLEPARFNNPIKRLFSNYGNDFHDKESQDNGKIRIAELIEAELIDKIKHLPENLQKIS